MSSSEPSSETPHLNSLKTLFTWLAFFVVAGLVFQGYLADKMDPNRELAHSSSSTLVLKRNQAGHYVAPGTINGVQVQFLLDSGATLISIPASIAAKAHLNEGAEVGSNTANGVVNAYQTQVDEVRLGGLIRYQAQALINTADQGQDVLLGMNFLKHYQWQQRGDTLTLTPQ